MNATLEKVENSEAYLEFVIEAEKIEEGLEKSYKKNVKKYNISGFREGNAPRAILEAKHGQEIFLEDALDFIVPNEYYEAITELGLTTIGDPDIEVGFVEKGKPVTVKVCVPVKPKVTLGKLEGLEIVVPKTNEVTDKDIEKYIQDLRSKNKIVITKQNEPAVLGDTVTFDYKCTMEDALFDGQEDFKLVLGSDTFFPGFEDKLVGVKKGDELDVEISFAEGISGVQLAGKSAVFKVNVKNVENIQLRELDDQFAREIGKVNSLEELYLDSKRKMLEIAAQNTSNIKKQAAVKALVEKCDVSVPESIVMQHAQEMLGQFSKQITDQGGTIDLYLQMTNSNVETLKKQIWEDAKNLTKSNFILDKIIEEKEFEVSEKELNIGIESFVRSIGMDIDVDMKDPRKNLGPLVDRVIFDLKAGKAAQYLVDHAVITIAERNEEKLN